MGILEAEMFIERQNNVASVGNLIWLFTPVILPRY